jgi:SRSO17 transposase
LSGLLRMETHRHFTGIGREAGVEGQNMQHFMSNSPWSGAAVCAQVQKELQATPALTTGGVLLVDESADEKASDQSAGSSKQYNGRLGKVETSQVGVFLSYVNLKVPQGFWTWITGQLFLPEAWFNEHHQALRKRLGIPDSLIFNTKIELAWDAIKEVIDRNLPFEIVGFDTLYGRDSWFRAQVRNAGKVYMAEVPVDTHVYLEKPEMGIPERKSKQGRPPSPSIER